MAIHCFLLIILSLVAIIINIPYYRFERAAVISYSTIPLVDMIVQLLICYICSNAGATTQRSKFDCFINKTVSGEFEVFSKLKECFGSQIGIPYAQ